MYRCSFRNGNGYENERSGYCLSIETQNKARTGIWILRGLMIAGILYGSVKEAALAWQLGDIGVGLMAWINLPLYSCFRKQSVLCAITKSRNVKA